jgi:NADH-quinone oxidoreductase subunit N
MNIDLNYITQSLHLFIPELVISATLVLIVLADLISGQNRKLLPYISVGGLLVAGYFVIDLFGTNSFAFSLKEGSGMMIVDSFGNFFKILVIVSTIFVVIFSATSKEIKDSFERHGEYYTLMFGMVLGMFFMISAADLIIIYLALELLSLSSYILAGFNKTVKRNSEASLKYVIYGSISSGIMLFGISLLFGLTGSTNLYEINSLIQMQEFQSVTFLLSGLLIFVGVGYKISAAPFHFWTPDVYEGAPVAITAYLSVASKAAGFALLIRFIKITFMRSVDSAGYWHLIELFDWQTFLVAISILTMTLGNFAALWQRNLKRMLAYSSIAHAGYLLLGLATLSNQGILAIIVYFAIYAFMNLGAFLVVMLIANKTGSEELDDYNGLGYATPLLGVSLAIFLVSLTGLPPTAGFIAKLYLFIALIDANMVTVAVIALLNTVVSLYYYIRVLKHMYLNKSEKELGIWQVSGVNTAVVLALVIPVLIFGIYFTPLLDFAKNSVTMLGF